ncbi:hypothetical protein BCON_0070g00020 [Botryotinia convoluta]|uniref:Aminoglycoside phosphotransferase domain-containing protein n=1 Tax=Botryotinia convoluta TaxID=54673 RepID=A0A4Z1IDG9_9HELO|nr:hypothetical protein BCON_0070g00020 [Botryotinia convoluta]
MTTEGSLEEERPWLESQWYPPLNKIKRFFYDCHKLNGVYTLEENERKWRIQNGSWPMGESMKEIDDDPDAWLICNLILRRSEGRSPSADWYDEKDNSSYHITDAPTPPPKATFHKRSTRRFRAGGDIPLVSYLDTRVWMTNSTTFSIGYAGVLKMGFIHLQHDLTHQSVTLNWMKGKLSPEQAERFKIPKVIRYEVQMMRHISFETQLYGLNFEQAWPILSPQQRENVITAVKDFCFELSKIKGDKIGSVEGKGIMDKSLPVHYQLGVSPYDPAGMQDSWAETALAPGLSEFCFAHNGLWPHHIILMDYPNGGYSDLRVPTIGLASWSLAGFVPKVWVRTKFAVDQMYDMSPVQMLDVNLNSGIRPDELHKYKWSAFRGLGRAPYNMPEIRGIYWRANPMNAEIMGKDFVEGRGALISFGGSDAEAFIAQMEAEEQERRRNRPGER